FQLLITTGYGLPSHRWRVGERFVVLVSGRLECREAWWVLSKAAVVSDCSASAQGSGTAIAVLTSWLPRQLGDQGPPGTTADVCCHLQDKLLNGAVRTESRDDDLRTLVHGI